MSARASVYYAADYLTDVLLLEGVHVHGTQMTLGEGTKIAIAIHDDDNLIDDLVESLTKLQRDRRLSVARREVKRLEAQRQEAIAAKQRRHKDWAAADEHERSVHHELHVAQKALEALEEDAK